MMPHNHFKVLLFAVGLQFVMAAPAQAADAPGTSNTPSKKTEAIPWDQLGANAAADYHGDGLSVAATAAGARLHCAFQRLDGEATDEGLWLVSTVTNPPGDRFRMVATQVGRVSPCAPALANDTNGAPKPARTATTLALYGKVDMTGQTVRFSRPGLVEEYSVSMDGVKQDFVVTEKPAGDGELKVQLAVTGARVEPAGYGAQLVLEPSGRQLAYGRLRATDANGKELPARIEMACRADSPLPAAIPRAWERERVAEGRVTGEGKNQITGAHGMTRPTLAIVVNDANAVYPVRIDPTFSDANWISMSPSIPGVNGTIYAAVMDDLGNLYIGGGFTAVGNVLANSIAQWNGSSWSPLGSGVSYCVLALAVSGTNLYAGGSFTTSGDGSQTLNYIAQWNGSGWSPLGSGTDGSVWALAVSGTNLYAGGYFMTAGGMPANYIAQWNGSSWSPLGSGTGSVSSYPPYVYALAVSGGTLYAGGIFTTAGGTNANCIAQWNGTNWLPLGSGMNRSVNALAVSGGTLYAGGYFTAAGGNPATNIAQWNGSSWSALGLGVDNSVLALAVSGTNLYAGGYFTTAGGNPANCIALWNGNSWSPLGLGTGPVSSYPDVNALAVSGTNLYAGGQFGLAGGVPAARLAQWNGSAWSAVISVGSALGLGNGVQALAVSGSTLYVGGAFLSAGTNTANYIAQWNGSRWSPLGSGLDGSVYVLAMWGTNLYAGGDFTTSGDGSQTLNYIAQWNGNSWSPLGSGLDGAVLALAVWGTNLYAGGDFTTSGNGKQTLNCIAQWNGSSWSPLGSGMSGEYPGAYTEVSALAASCGTLYAGGWFGNPANFIAQWNGSSWSALGFGLAGQVWALAVSGSTLYAGGGFIYSGDGSGQTLNYIAQWNGSSWSPLGSGMNDVVYALAVSGTNVYAGGFFTTAGGTNANCIAQWNGSTWAPLGSGVGGGYPSDNGPYGPLSPCVDALAVSGGTLYAGGYFTTAGGKVSAYAAEATIGPPTILCQPQCTNVMAGSDANFAVGADGQPLSYQWFKNGNGLSDGGNVSGSASTLLLLTNLYVDDPGYYLAVVANNFGSVTSSVATLTVSNLPLVLAGGPGNLGCTSNQFWVTVAGPVGSNVVVYASTNLQTWLPLATNPLSLGAVIFTDALATNYPSRFYRAGTQ